MDKIRIFVTLGSQQFQFNRLLKLVDGIDVNKYDVFAQIGYSDYKPRNFQYVDFLDRDSFAENINKADLIITHAGTGAIITALKNKKKVIAVARLKKYGEHVDNHQVELIDVFVKKNYITGLIEVDNLNIILEDVIKKEFNLFESNTDFFIENLIKLIEL